MQPLKKVIKFGKIKKWGTLVPDNQAWNTKVKQNMLNELNTIEKGKGNTKANIFRCFGTL